MKKEQDVLESVKEEEKALGVRVGKLVKFTESDDFEELPCKQQKWLMEQQAVMLAYQGILQTRIEHFKKRLPTGDSAGSK